MENQLSHSLMETPGSTGEYIAPGKSWAEFRGEKSPLESFP